MFVNTSRIVAGLQYIQTIKHTWSISAYTRMLCSSYKCYLTVWYVVVTKVTCKNTVKWFWWSVFYFTDLYSLSILLHFLVCSTCDVICKQKKLLECKFCKLLLLLYSIQKTLKMIFCVSTPPKLYICTIKSAWIFSCPPPFKSAYNVSSIYSLYVFQWTNSYI